MKRATLIIVALALLSGTVGRLSADVVYPTNNGFETPDLGSSDYAYTYQPSGAGWTFSTYTGIAANGSLFNLTNATNGNNDGTTSTAGQAGFIQDVYYNVSSISQQVTLTGGVASVSFSLEARPNSTGSYVDGGNNPIEVFLGSTQLGGTYQSSTTTSFTSFTTPGVDLTAGTYTLSFVGTYYGSGDNTQFIDNVSINSVPEPSGIALLGMATLMFAGYYGWRGLRQLAPA